VAGASSVSGVVSRTEHDAARSEIDFVRIYRDMVRCREFEKLFVETRDEGHAIVGWHPCIGEEGLCAVYSQLKDGDYCGYTHRVFYPWLCRGIDVVSLYAEACGRVAGTAKGKGGTHVAGLPQGILGRSGMQGGHFPLFVGSAIAQQFRGDGGVSVVTAGEGCSTAGLLHEAANHAAVWKLPVVFVCDNNQYMQSVPMDLIWAQPDVSRMADAYDMPSIVVSGGDPVAVAQAAREAIDRARSGGGPTFLEVKMIRWGTHYMNEPDGQSYRDYEGITEAKEHADPIANLGAYLVEQRISTQDELNAVQVEAQKEMEDGVAAALASPPPDASEAYTDIFQGWVEDGGEQL
jgi:TPP-dependent pyruvate/acetoin dehydrogenase alpha subunit